MPEARGPDPPSDKYGLAGPAGTPTPDTLGFRPGLHGAQEPATHILASVPSDP